MAGEVREFETIQGVARRVSARYHYDTVQPSPLTGIVFFLSMFHFCSTNVSRKIDRVLSVWCQTQRVRCKVTLNSKGGVAAAGNVILSDNKSNPLTKEQFQLLEGIGFATSAKRKKYDSSVNDRKWEEKL